MLKLQWQKPKTDEVSLDEKANRMRILLSNPHNIIRIYDFTEPESSDKHFIKSTYNIDIILNLIK